MITTIHIPATWQTPSRGRETNLFCKCGNDEAVYICCEQALVWICRRCGSTLKREPRRE